LPFLLSNELNTSANADMVVKRVSDSIFCVFLHVPIQNVLHLEFLVF